MNSLFRGFGSKLISGVQKNIFYHTPRIPRDTELGVHENADLWLHEKFGIRARSSSLICTTNFDQARSYGYTYRVTPIEPISIIYSPLVKDFLEHELELSSDSQSDVWAWLECKNFKMVRSVKDIEPDFFGEVMVHCEHYSVTPY